MPGHTGVCANEMDREQFTIRGATGVDLELAIAGPGSRSYAFIIDWHIRIVAALGWLTAASLIVNGALTWRSGAGKSSAASIFFILLPPLLIYFLYHPVLEVLMRGRTPGKRTAGVRIVNRDGGTPSTGALLIRNVFRLVDSLPACYLLGLATAFASAQRVRIGDMAAGTLLVIDDGTASKLLDRIGTAAGSSNVDLQMKDLAEDLLERWPALDRDKRAAIARALLKGTKTVDLERIDAMTDQDLKAAVVSLTRASTIR